MTVKLQVENRPWLRRLITGFPPWQPRFDTSSSQVGFEVDKMALQQVS
jgi:hypothetical protein